MNQLDMDLLEREFGIRPYRTRGNQEGCILRFPFFYLKVYPGKSDFTYSVQVWLYERSIPIGVEEVRMNEMVRYVHSILSKFNVPWRRHHDEVPMFDGFPHD